MWGRTPSYTVIELFPKGTRFDAIGFTSVSAILLIEIFLFFCCSKFLLPVLFFFFVFQCDSDSDQEEKVRKEISMGTKIICWIHLLLLFCYLFRVSFWIDLKPLCTEKRLSFI